MNTELETIRENLTVDLVLDQLMEEAAEVIQAANKVKRAMNEKNPTSVTKEKALKMLEEELTDVLVCAEVLKQFEAIEYGEITEKVKRWADRLKTQNNNNDGWIPVEERLPEEQTRVICQFDNGDIELLWQDWESDSKTLMYLPEFAFMAEKKVIAWRSLPEPYKPGRN